MTVIKYNKIGNARIT